MTGVGLTPFVSPIVDVARNASDVVAVVIYGSGIAEMDRTFNVGAPLV